MPPVPDRKLLVVVPGAGIRPEDFETEGLFAAMNRRHPGVAVTAVDPGLDSYLDGTVERHLLAGIDAARGEGTRLWLAGISLGCQAILRCVRQRTGLAEGVILLTPYLASTGRIAEVARAGGLRRWKASKADPEAVLLTWLAETPENALPRVVLGHAHADRFATTAAMLADLWPAARAVSVPGGHDWASWRELWRLALDTEAFA